MAKYQPLTREEVQAESQARLAEMKETGIKIVSVLGCGTSDDCEACAAMRDQRIEIEFAQPLPLPGCDKEFCKCLYIAVE